MGWAHLPRLLGDLAGHRLSHARALLAQVFLEGYKRVDAVLFFELPSADPLISGARPAILATIYLGIIIIALSVPLGVGTAIYLEEYANRDRWYNRMLEVNIQNPLRVPSIVYVILGLAFLVRGIGLGRVLLVGGMILTLLVLPTVITAARGDSRRPGLDPPGRLRAGLDEVAGRLGGVPSRRSRDRDRLDPRALPWARGERATAASRSAHVRLVQPDDHGRLHSPFPCRSTRGSRPQEEFRDAGRGGDHRPPRDPSSLNAPAIWLRNKYERRW